jgi:hypothetical protein
MNKFQIPAGWLRHTGAAVIKWTNLQPRSLPKGDKNGKEGQIKSKPDEYLGYWWMKQKKKKQDLDLTLYS